MVSIERLIVLAIKALNEDEGITGPMFNESIRALLKLIPDVTVGGEEWMQATQLAILAYRRAQEDVR